MTGPADALMVPTRGSLASSVDPRFSHHYARVGEIKLHYVAGGEGYPVLLVPGWLQTWYAWRDIMSPLADAGFHVIAVDLRGMGHSTRPLAGYDTGQLGRDLSVLMSHLGHRRYALVGHDIGMWVGYAVAADEPDTVERLVVLEGGIPGLIQPSPEVLMPQAQSAFFWQFMFNQQPDLPELLIEGRESPFMNYLFHKWSYRPDRIASDIYVDTYSSPGSMRAQMAYYRAFPETMTQNVERARKKLTMPVLALGGDHGVGDLPHMMLKPVAADVRGGIIENCGHFAPEESPEGLFAQLLPFLQEDRRQ